MSDIAAYGRVQFIDGLIGYLEVRAWAFEKISTTPVGASLVDMKMHHALYFTYLFSAIEFVRDHLPNDGEKTAFIGELRQGFPVPEDYAYARQLRNAIVHRGLDPSMIGIQQGDRVFARCPPVVFKMNSTEGHACSAELLVGLATLCNKASNGAILMVLEREGLLDVPAHTPDQTQMLDEIAASPFMPDWAKGMALQAFATMDVEAVATQLAQSRVTRLRAFLDAASSAPRQADV